MDHLEPALKDRYARHAKAYTEHTLLLKRRAADRRVRKYTAMAAANGLNPVVGMDAVIDARILKEMYQGIRTDFGLGKWDLPIEGNRVNLVKKSGRWGYRRARDQGPEPPLTQTGRREGSQFIPLVRGRCRFIDECGQYVLCWKRICQDLLRVCPQTAPDRNRVGDP